MEVVCLVEGDRSVRQALARLLDAEGIAVLPFERLEAFLVAVPGTTVPTCAVIDFSGARAWRPEQLQALAAVAAGTPVIAVDASDAAGTRRVARRVGAHAFFRKPIDGAALIDAIRWVLRSEAAGAGTLPGSGGTGNGRDPDVPPGRPS